jgi:PAS domain S-box-containing protein
MANRTKTNNPNWFVSDNWDWIKPMRRRIALLVLVFAALPIVCLTVFDLLQLRRRAVAAAEERLYQIAVNARERVLQRLEEKSAVTRALESDALLRRDLQLWIENADSDAIHRATRIFETMVGREQFRRASFLAPDGRLLILAEKDEGGARVATHSGSLTLDPANAEIAKIVAERGTFYIQDLRATPRGAELIFAAPIWKESQDGGKQLLGVWANTASPEDILYPLLRKGPGATGETYLYREEKSAGAQVFLSPTLTRPHAALRMNVPLELAQKTPPRQPGLGEKSSFVARDYDGKTVLSVPLAIALNDGRGNALLRWTLATQQEFEEAIGADLREQEKRSLFLMAVCFLGVGMLAYSMEKRLAVKRLSVSYHYANSLINSEGNLIYAVDRAYRIQHVNNPMSSFARGRRLDNVVGKNILDVIATPELRPVFRDVLDDIFEGRRASFARETAFGPPNDPSHWFTTISPLIVDGRIEGAVVSLSDVTEQVKMRLQMERRNRELRALYDINRAITEVSSEELILRVVADGARHAVGAAHAVVLRYDAARDELRCAGATDQSVAEHCKNAAFARAPRLLAWKAADLNRSVAVENLAAEADANEPLAVVARARSAVLTPLLYQNALVGVLVVYETALMRRFSQEDVMLLDEIAKQAAIALHGAELLRSHRETSERLSYVMNNVQEVIFQTDKEGRVTFLNSAAQTVLGGGLDEKMGKLLEEFVAVDERAELRRKLAAALKGENAACELHVQTPRGQRLLAMTLGAWRNPAGEILGAQGLARDVTEQRETQQQLLQAQKMESLGALAGGVAHDFNNLLTALSGYLSLILAKCEPTHPWRKALETMDTSIERMASLTKQLLAFGRKSVNKMQPTDLNKIVREVHAILSRTVDRNIEFRIQTSESLPCVEADPTQLNQVLMNLCINARDAMPDGGTITIQTQEVHLQENSPRRPSHLSAGSYVQLTVADTGKGIAKEIQHRVFEPFFTTKPIGKGTGLGLSLVYGIVQAHHGHISFTSQPGKGTTFTIMLPSIGKPIEQVAETAKPAEPSGGGETILLVDDEEILLDLGRSILEGYGYKVFTTSNPLEAVEIYRAHHREIGLVVTDIMMPQMTARELYPQLKEINPSVKVLLSSGYSSDGVAQSIIEQGACGFLSKPYRIKEMAATVREALDGKKVTQPATG